MKKRIVATLLSTVMLTCALAGCGNQTQQSSKGTEKESSVISSQSSVAGSEAESKEVAIDAFKGTTLEIAVLKSGLASWEDLNDLEIFKLAEKETGIHIEWLVLDDSTATEKMPLILSGNDRPDGYFRTAASFVSSNLEMFYDLSEEGLLETYAPNVLADYEQMQEGGGLENLREEDGSIRALYGAREVSVMPEAQGIMYINKQWLEKVGKKVPTTADEFYDVMCAFRDSDINGNGKKDEIPLEFSKSNWAAQIMNLANSFGIAGESSANKYHYFKVENKTVVPQADTEQFRAFLEYANKLASEGLLDVEGFSQTNEQYVAKLNDRIVGCYYGWTPATNYGGEEGAANWVTLKPFKALDGVEPVKTGVEFMNTWRKMLSVDKDCSNVEALLHWWNYLSSSTEMKYTLMYGPQGVIWDIVDGKPVLFSEKDCKVEFTDTFTLNDYIYKEGLTVDIAPLLLQSEYEVLDLTDEKAINTVRYYACEEIRDMLVQERLPQITVPADRKEEIALTETDVVEYIDSFVATSIVDGITDATWNSYLEGLNGIGFYEWIDWMNDVYYGN